MNDEQMPHLQQSEVVPVRSSVGHLLTLVEELINDVRHARSLPLSQNALVDREKTLSRLETLLRGLPDELRAARWMVRERENFMRRAQEQAEEIVSRAKSEARRLVSQSHILEEAVAEANALVRRAEGEARRTRLETEDMADAVMESLETLIGELAARVSSTRTSLHSARPVDPAPPI
jgi:cell division septum initiation protein DivIVA